MPSSSTHALIGGLVGAVFAVGVVLQSDGRLQTRDGRVLDSAWNTLIWNERTDDVKQTLVDPDPEALEALGARRQVNGTHVVEVGGRRVVMVAFEDRVKLVDEVRQPGGKKSGILNKVLFPMVSSPLMGLICGFLVMAALYILLRPFRPVWVNRVFGKLQLISSGYMGWSHGMNDATKTMGLITLALFTATSAGIMEGMPGWLQVDKTPDPYHLTPVAHFVSILPPWLQFNYMPDPADLRNPGIPPWVIVTCALTMAAGTAAGGWRIIKTMGHKVVKLQPVHGFAAETTAASVLYVTATLGMPVSTTHAITTSIMGVGCAKRFSALKLRVVERIIWAWVLTIPATGGLAFALVWFCARTGILSLKFVGAGTA
jgi:phosphate/sulfate permease